MNLHLNVDQVVIARQQLAWRSRQPIILHVRLIAYRHPAHEISRHPIDPIHTPRKSDKKARPGHIGHSAESADDRALARPNLSKPGEEIHRQQQSHDNQELAHDHDPPDVLAGESASRGGGNFSYASGGPDGSDGFPFGLGGPFAGVRGGLSSMSKS